MSDHDELIVWVKTKQRCSDDREGVPPFRQLFGTGPDEIYAVRIDR